MTAGCEEWGAGIAGSGAEGAATAPPPRGGARGTGFKRAVALCVRWSSCLQQQLARLAKAGRGGAGEVGGGAGEVGAGGGGGGVGGGGSLTFSHVQQIRTFSLFLIVLVLQTYLILMIIKNMSHSLNFNK